MERAGARRDVSGGHDSGRVVASFRAGFRGGRSLRSVGPGRGEDLPGNCIEPNAEGRGRRSAGAAPCSNVRPRAPLYAVPSSTAAAVGGQRQPKQSRCYNPRMDSLSLPGEELISQGIEDLQQGTESVPALLVSIGAPRLRLLNLGLPARTFPSPELRLYRRLSDSDPDSAHSRYNALIRRLVSFERAAECVS
jgi:hypothetical protein